MKTKQAQYECLRCCCKFETAPGPVICPLCGSLYIHWLDYEEFDIYRRKDLTNV